VQYCAYFVERKYFENTQWQPYDKSYCDAKLPLHRKNSSKTNLIAFPCYNHVTTVGTLIALSEQSEQLDTTDNLRIELNDASTQFRPNPGGMVPKSERVVVASCFDVVGRFIHRYRIQVSELQALSQPDT
jgi:hypothetical protein